MTTNPLIGKTITSIKIADDKSAILFITNEKEIIAIAEAECCSYTWIEHIELPVNGFPATVLTVEDIDLLIDEEAKNNGYSTQFYGCKIETDKGTLLLDYRNESASNYNGYLTWQDNSLYKYKPISEYNWIEVKEDI